MFTNLRKDLDLADTDKMDKTQKDFFVNKALPDIILTILKSKIITDEFYEANCFLIYWLKTRIKYFGNKNESDSKILPKIFKRGSKFYELSLSSSLGIYGMEQKISKEKIETTTNYSIYAHQTYDDKIKFLQFNVNLFGQMGGFDSMRNGIANSEAKSCYIPIIRRWLKTMVNCSEFLTNDHVKLEGLNVCKLTLDFIKRLKDNEISECKEKEIRKILAYIHKIQKEFRGYEAYLWDELELDFCIWTLKIPNKKIIGIDIINGQLTTIKDKFPGYYVMHDNPMKKIMKWCEENKIYELLFENTEFDIEIIKKCGLLLELLYSWEIIKGKHIFELLKIANSVENKLVQKALYSIIEQPILHFSRLDSIQLFTEIKQISYPLLTENTLKIISALAKNEFYRKEAHENGIGLMRKSLKVFILNDTEGGCYNKETDGSMVNFIWELLQHDLNSEIQGNLCDLFINLNIEFSREELRDFIKKCEEKILADNNFKICSKIYMKFVEQINKENKGKPHEIKSKMLDFSMLSLLALKKSTVQNILSFENGDLNREIIMKNEENDINDKKLVEYLKKCKYYEELEQRFDFLAFLIIVQNEQIEKEDIQTLCESFLFNGFSLKEVETLFTFFAKLLSSNISKVLVVSKVFDTLFFEILLKHDPQQFIDPELSCFLRIFVLMNSAYKRLKVNYDETVNLLSNKIIGLDHLWRICFGCTDNTVKQTSFEFIKKLYSNISSELTSEQKLQISEDFINKCFSYIISKNENTVILSLELLLGYLKENQSNDLTPSTTSMNSFDLTFQDSNSKTVCVNVTPDTKVIDCIDTALALLGSASTQLEKLKFVCEGKELNPTAEPLSQYGILSPALIEISDRYNAMFPSLSNQNINNSSDENKCADQLIPMFPDLSPEVIKLAAKNAKGDINQALEYLTNDSLKSQLISSLPSKIESIKKIHNDKNNTVLLKNDKYFEILYTLLESHNTEICEKTWEIINLLPIHHNILSIVYQLNNYEEWKNILLHNSGYKISYILRALDSEFNSKISSDLIINFVKNNGFNILIEILNQQISLSDVVVIENKCKLIDTVLKILNRFIETALAYFSDNLYKKYYEQHKNYASLYENLPKYDLDTQKLIYEKFNSVEIIEKIILILTRLIDEFNSDMNLQFTRILHVLLILHEDLINEILYKNLDYKNLLFNILRQNYASQDFKQILFIEISNFIELLNLLNKNAKFVKLFYLNCCIEILLEPNISLANFDQFFIFFESLLDLYLDRELSAKIIIPKNDIANKLLEIIANSGIEKIAAENKISFNGFLQIIYKIIKDEKLIIEKLPTIAKQKLFEFFMNETFGFYKETSYPRKCNLDTILKYVIPILILLISNENNNAVLFSTAIKFHNEQLRNVASQPKNENKNNEFMNNNGYVGLKNFGCTCYINSLFQQLFMMPNFREKLLQIDSKKLENSGNNRVLINLQNIFKSLQNPAISYYEPIDFCHDFKDSDGNSIRTNIQQDVDEFFNHLTDKIESELNILGENQILKKELEITVDVETASLETQCHHKSKNSETYLSLPLSIKGCKTMEEALSNFVRGCILDGSDKWFCEEHKQNFKANRRMFIEKLSDTVLINLKRFEYNPNTQTRKKLNDYFSFPETIDFYRWTQDGQHGKICKDSKEFRYKLVGVVIHSGYTDAGHYYSFIKERSPNSQNNGKWFEFNDTHISEFNIGNMKNYAFGGQSLSSMGYENSANAYLLFYQKESNNNLTNSHNLPVKMPIQKNLINIPDSQISYKIVIFSLIITIVFICRIYEIIF